MSLPRRYQDKLRKDEQEAAHVFQDFIDTFQNVKTPQTKTFVRSTTLYSQDQENEKLGTIYNPTPLIKTNKEKGISTALECATILKPLNLDKPKKNEKPKSNLEQFKDELKQRHAEKGERARIKEELEASIAAGNYLEVGDPNSTNLFITNLSPNITENHLMLEFGLYGPLASVKIMWPRGEEKVRNFNCGFVAYMSRKDAERALKFYQRRGDVRIDWGKSVEIPSHPIYIPNELLKFHLPPPLSGLPFNAQPTSLDWVAPTDEKDFEEFLKTCQVKVTVPLNKKLLMTVHRMVEFVIREGPMFEAFIMNKEIDNPDFRFLFDCQSHVHIYYRWKIFSILNGDSQKSWSMKPFQMFECGSVWIPPVAPNYTEGMPDELIREMNKNKLSDAQTKRLVSLIRNLTMNRAKISEAMIYCLNHKDYMDDILEIILESLMNLDTTPPRKIARLYLLSDVLTNAVTKGVNIFLLEDITNLIQALKVMHESLNHLKFESDRTNCLQRVAKVIDHWKSYPIFSADVVKKIDENFPNPREEDKLVDNEDNSSIDEPLDGANLLKRSKDGDIGPEVVTVMNLSGKDKEQRIKEESLMTQYFIPSKWDAIDPEEVEAQAVSTEEIYYMERLKLKQAKKYKSKKKRYR